MKKTVYSIFLTSILLLQSFSAMALEEKEFSIRVYPNYVYLDYSKEQEKEHPYGYWENVVAMLVDVADSLEKLKKEVNPYKVNFKDYTCVGKIYKSKYEETSIYEIKDCKEKR